MKMSTYACAALLATTAAAAWSGATIPVYGRAGMPVGSDRHAYIVDTARPPSFDAQLQADAGPGRAGGLAAQALANVRPAAAGVARGGDGLHRLAFGRAGYVPDFVAPAAPPLTRHEVSVAPGAGAEASTKP